MLNPRRLSLSFPSYGLKVEVKVLYLNQLNIKTILKGYIIIIYFFVLTVINFVL